MTRSHLFVPFATLLVLAALPAPPASAAAPVVTGLSVHAGPPTGGQTISVYGSGFAGLLNTCSPQTAVWFGARLNPPHDPFLGKTPTVVSDTEITVVTPAIVPTTVDVVVTNRCGTSAVNAPADQYTFDGSPRCAATCSMTVDATSVLGPVRHSAAGLLHGYVPPFDASPALRAKLTALDLGYWRVSTYAWRSAALAHDLGIPTIELVSDDWDARHHGTKPWDNLNMWRNFVTQLVSDPAVQPVAYWDILNEPGAKPFDGGTVQQYQLTYDVAYQAIKMVNPAFKMVAPSLGAYRDSGDGLNLKNFLDHAQALGESFDAISWHEIDDWWPMDFPRFIPDHVARARALLASHSALAGARIFVDEYNGSSTPYAPGWRAAHIGFLEDAQVDEGNSACWDLPGSTISGCQSQFDGLIGPDLETPMPLYWVYRRYADHTGNRVALTTGMLDLNGLASVGADGTLRVLLGRHVDCGFAPLPRAGAPWPVLKCPNGTPSAMAGPADVTVDVVLPLALAGLSSVQVTTERIPNQTGTLPALSPVTTTVPVANGHASVTVTMADGDAAALTVAGLS